MVLGLWPLSAQNEVNSDFWAATDALGRELHQYGAPKGDKTVIMFYWTWHQQGNVFRAERIGTE